MDSHLKIVAGFKEGESYVKDLYVSLPFRVVSVGQRKSDKKTLSDGDELLSGNSGWRPLSFGCYP